jgi:hypothetical protein
MVVVSIKAVNLPPDCLENSLNFVSTQFLAAPIPLLESFCVLKVLRVPKLTILEMYERRLSAFTSPTIFSISGSFIMMFWLKVEERLRTDKMSSNRFFM